MESLQKVLKSDLIIPIVLQKSSTTKLRILDTPLPSDLNADDTLDYEENATITNTSSEVVEVFCNGYEI